MPDDINIFQASDPDLDTLARSHGSLIETQQAISALEDLKSLDPTYAKEAKESVKQDAATGAVNVDLSSIGDIYSGLASTASKRDNVERESWYRWGLRAAGQVGYAPLGGLIGAINETGKEIRDISVWLHKQAKGSIPETVESLLWHGIDNPEDEQQIIGLPELGTANPDTVPGQIAKSIAQFAWGLAGTGKLFKTQGLAERTVVGGKSIYQGAGIFKDRPLALMLTQGALTAATVFDGHEANIGNIIKDFPALQGPLTNWMSEYLATGEEDNQFTGKLKNALASVPLGLGTEAMFRMLGAAGKQMRAAANVMSNTDQSQLAKRTLMAQMKGLDATERRIVLFGDPTKQAFSLYDLGQDVKQSDKALHVAPAPGYRYYTEKELAAMPPDARTSAIQQMKVLDQAKTNADFKAAADSVGAEAVTLKSLSEADDKTIYSLVISPNGKVFSGVVHEDFDKYINVIENGGVAISASKGTIGGRFGEGIGSTAYGKIKSVARQFGIKPSELYYKLEDDHYAVVNKHPDLNDDWVRLPQNASELPKLKTIDEPNTWSLEHAAEGAEKQPQIIRPVEYPKGMNRVPTNIVNDDGTSAKVKFQTNEDRLAYIASSTSSKAEEARAVLNAAGWTDVQIDNIGKSLRTVAAQQLKENPAAEVVTPPKTARRIYSESLGDLLGVSPDYVATAITRVPISNTKGIEINWGATRDPEGIAQLITQVKEAFLKDPELRTWKQAADEANVSDILDKALGTGGRGNGVLNDAETEALRLVRAGSYFKLKELADIIRFEREQPGGVSQDSTYAFALQLETQRLLNNYWKAAGTAAARAFNIRKNSALAREPLNAALNELQAQIASVRGAKNVEFMADVVANLDTGTEDAMKAFNKLVKGGAWLKAGKYIRAAWMNALLSSPPSIIANNILPYTVVTQQMIERGMGIATNNAIGDAAGMTMGSLLSYIQGYFSALPEAVRYFPDALRFGGKGRAWGEQYARGVADQLSEPGGLEAVMSSYLNPGGNQWLNRGIDLLGYVNSWATRLNVASDEFHTTMIYRAELRRLAYDRAHAEQMSGQIRPQDFASRIGELLSNPLKEDVERAVENAKVTTFTQNNEGVFMRIANAVQDFPYKGAPIGGWIILPFKHVPANILSYAWEHSPGLAFSANKLRSDIAKGGEDAQVALAKMAGAAITVGLGIDMYQRGLLTGKGSYNPAEAQLLAREGIMPYSVKIGDKYWRYSRLDAQGMVWGAIGDVGDLYSYIYDSDYNRALDIEKAVASLIVGMAGSLLNKTYMKGISDLVQATGDPVRHAQKLITGLGASFIPNSGLLRGIARAEDNYIKEVVDIVDRIKANTPGLSTTQPVRFDLFGRPMTVSRGSSQTWNALTPFESSVSKPEPIDAEMAKYKIYLQMPDKTFTVGNYNFDMRADNRAYSRYVELAGNAAKHEAFDGMGAKDLLNAIVSGKHQLSEVYNALPTETGKDGARYAFIRSIVNDYRKLAQMQLIKEMPNIYHTQRINLPSIGVE